MTATPQSPWAPAPRPNPWSAGRIIALVLGLLVLLFSTLLLMGGGALLSPDLTRPPVPPWVPPAQADRATAPDGQPSPERTPKQS